MKIIQVISSFEMGGAERVAINIAKSHSSDFKYYLIEVVKGNSDYSNEIKKEIKNNGITFYCSPFKNKKIAIMLFWLWFIWKYLYIRPNIIHSHTEIPDLSLWIFRKIAWIFFWIQPQYIRTIHNTELWNKWKKIGHLVESYYQKHDSNIFISSSTQDSYSKNYGKKSPNIIYNGIEETEQIHFENIKKDKINILFAGRLEYQKGIDELIKIITVLKDDNRFYFHIVGDGSLKKNILSSIKDFRNVTYYSKIYGLSKYIGSFDYLFMPSNHEGLALLPIEASLAHTPSIINSCPGLKDTLPNDWELSVQNNSISDFLFIFNNLSKYNYSYLSEKAYQFANTNFSIEKMQEEYEKFYKKKK